jgi:hypothetical protein
VHCIALGYRASLKKSTGVHFSALYLHWNGCISLFYYYLCNNLCNIVVKNLMVLVMAMFRLAQVTYEAISFCVSDVTTVFVSDVISACVFDVIYVCVSDIIYVCVSGFNLILIMVP